MPEAIKGVKLKEKGDTFTVQKGNLVATAWNKSKQNQNKYLYHFLDFLQVEYCILFWSAKSTPNINLLYKSETIGADTFCNVPSFFLLCTTR
jgi:hypothetical protein